MNAIRTKSLKEILTDKARKLLSLYYTIGYPKIEDADLIFQAISETNKVDFIELGMPYSDPLADGPTIQQTSSVAIRNGVTIHKYFEIAKHLRKQYRIPLIFMGYLNPVMQFGMEKFCKGCVDAGIEGVIIPDLPVEIYEQDYQEIFAANNLLVSFLITPTTSEKRIRKIEERTTGFIYVVSENSITGKNQGTSIEQASYFERLKNMQLQRLTIAGFGIHDYSSFNNACNYFNGAIIGSAFLRVLENENIKESVSNFIQLVKP